MANRFSVVLRAGALATAIALVPVATAGLAAVDSHSGPQFARLFAVYAKIKEQYVEPVDDDRLIKGAINGMVAALDPHSAYLDQRDNANLQIQIDGTYGGLGLSVQMEDGAVKVIAPTKGSPAAAAGIKPGDFITHLDGKLLYGSTLDEAVDQMRGPAGTKITLTIYRPGRDDPFDVTITRQVIDLQPVDFKVVNGVGVISVSSFSENITGKVNDAWTKIRNQTGGHPAGLILDLRGDPGGLLGEAVGLSDLFLDSGVIVSQRARYARDSEVYSASPGDIARGLPVVVLIDEGTASASEIVAGALQDHHRALIMGQRSFGKGSVQTKFDLDDKTAVKLTTARYYTPSGRSVQEGGITPDIAVPQISDPDARKRAARAYRESDLRHHLANEIKDDKELEKDTSEDPRFKLTPEQLKAKGIDDFQLWYALQTIGHTNPATLAARHK